jgi:Phage gp6-like head-tail connector protein
MLKRVKLRLKQESNEVLLQELINTSKDKILLYIGGDTLPQQLETICVELTVATYNRLGSEGYASENVGEVSYTYSDDLLKPYKTVLDRYIAQSIDKGSGKGTVVFL